MFVHKRFIINLLLCLHSLSTLMMHATHSKTFFCFVHCYIVSASEQSVCVCVGAKLVPSCPTLYDHMDYSVPGSSVHGILQTCLLEWVAISFSTEQCLYLSKF